MIDERQRTVLCVVMQVEILTPFWTITHVRQFAWSVSYNVAVTCCRFEFITHSAFAVNDLEIRRISLSIQSRNVEQLGNDTNERCDVLNMLKKLFVFYLTLSLLFVA